jgi:hypothetical protein
MSTVDSQISTPSKDSSNADVDNGADVASLVEAVASAAAVSEICNDIQITTNQSADVIDKNATSAFVISSEISLALEASQAASDVVASADHVPADDSN